MEIDFPPRTGTYESNTQRRRVWESFSALAARQGAGKILAGSRGLLSRVAIVPAVFVAGSHRRAADVLLPSGCAECVSRHEGFAVRGIERGVLAEHAPDRCAPDGASRFLAHVPCVLSRRI